MPDNLDIGNVYNIRTWSFIVLQECRKLKGYYQVRCLNSKDHHTVDGVYIVHPDDFAAPPR